jgi:multiple antibiotic resistance protein
VENFLLVFVPLFIAIDAFGVLPLFLSITEAETQRETKSIAGEASLTAMIVGTGFLCRSGYHAIFGNHDQ